MAEKIEFDLWIDTSWAKKKINWLRDDLEWFKKRIESEEAIKLSLDASKIDLQVEELKKKLRKAKAEWDQFAIIEIKAETKRLWLELTSANWQLRNFAKTGEKDVSVLGKMFNSVNDNIEKSRQTLIKFWESTAWLDKIEKEIKEQKKLEKKYQQLEKYLYQLSKA